MTNAKPNVGPVEGGSPRVRAATYRRVSTDEQVREGYSLDDQDARTREVVEREGWELIETYEDAGFSGDDPNRPGYKRMLEDVAAGKFDVLVVIALDRFGRDAWAIEGTLRFFDEHGVRLVSTRETIDRDTPEGALQTGILAQFAQFEKAKIKARTKAGIAARNRLGIPWGRPGLGYRAGDDGHWVEDPAHAEVVRLLFRYRVQDGLSYNAIAVRLNSGGIPSRTGKLWGAATVRNVIESKHVRGFFSGNGGWIKGRHDPIIDEATWDAAQRMVGRDAKFTPSRAGRHPARHLLTGGLLRCCLCDQTMYARTGAKPELDYYACKTNLLVGPGSCPMPTHKRSEVDGRFLAIFERTFLDVTATQALVATELDTDHRAITGQLRTAETELTKLEAQRKRLDRDYREEVVPAGDYARLSAALTEEAAAAGAARDRLRNNAEEVRRGMEHLDAESETLRRLAAIRDAVARQARDLQAQGDLVALRGVIATLGSAVHLRQDGTIAGLTAGTQLGGGHIVALDDGGAIRILPDNRVEREPGRHALPLQAGQTISTGSSLTL